MGLKNIRRSYAATRESKESAQSSALTETVDESDEESDAPVSVPRWQLAQQGASGVGQLPPLGLSIVPSGDPERLNASVSQLLSGNIRSPTSRKARNVGFAEDWVSEGSEVDEPPRYRELARFSIARPSRQDFLPRFHEANPGTSGFKSGRGEMAVVLKDALRVSSKRRTLPPVAPPTPPAAEPLVATSLDDVVAAFALMGGEPRAVDEEALEQLADLGRVEALVAPLEPEPPQEPPPRKLPPLVQEVKDKIARATWRDVQVSPAGFQSYLYRLGKRPKQLRWRLKAQHAERRAPWQTPRRPLVDFKRDKDLSFAGYLQRQEDESRKKVEGVEAKKALKERMKTWDDTIDDVRLQTVPTRHRNATVDRIL